VRPAIDPLDARRRVWEALSELYLDVDYRDFVRSAACTLAASPYTLDELRSILRDEVHPVLATNLCVSAGVWESFDQAWLGRAILRNRRRGWWRARAWCSRRVQRHLWDLLEPRIRRQRAAAVAFNEPGH